MNKLFRYGHELGLVREDPKIDQNWGAESQKNGKKQVS